MFETYQAWQRELERWPTHFMLRRLPGELDRVRSVLGEFVGADPEQLALVPNVTYGANAVLRSIDLAPGDEIVASKHEYGATDLLLDHLAASTGARVVRPDGHDADALAEAFGARTIAVVISHITSPTGLLLPVAEVTARARALGIVSVIDGAHAPGQLDLDISAVGADFYIGACHKWLCAPKSAAFVVVRPQVRSRVRPLVLGWGFGDGDFALAHEWRGARDPAAFLSIPAAVEYTRTSGRHDGARTLLHEARGLLTDVGLTAFAPDQGIRMAHFRLPPCDVEGVVDGLLLHRIEVPIRSWRGTPLLRLSIGDYTEGPDIERLADTVVPLLREHARPCPSEENNSDDE